jgi:hypothetical protein
MNDKTIPRGSTCVATREVRADGLNRAAGIVEALTAATKPADFVDALAWFEDKFPTQPAQVFLQVLQNRATLVYDCTVPQGSANVPTQALNNEVAYMMMKALALAFDICLTGRLRTPQRQGGCHPRCGPRE